ncbi:MAG: HAD-IA family hydrolase [Thalassospira sp.]|uniref:HAD-IA family hydrolase n=1 Tax=Thalassospira sp. TaxID=1912094 RepID=UPI0032EED2E5
MAKYIMFDLDGTLIDGVDDILFAMNGLLAAHDHAPLIRHDIEAMLGDGTWMLTKRAFAARGQTPDDTTLDELNVDFNTRYGETNYADTRLYENAENVLRDLKTDGWTIALASNKPEAPCKAILQKLGISDLFTVIAGGDSFDVKKPHGRFLRHVLDQLGHTPDSNDIALMVGDHANDVNAARAAGIHAIAVALEVSDGRALSLGADAVITDYRDLINAVERIISKDKISSRPT